MSGSDAGTGCVSNKLMKPIETGALDDAVADYMVSWTQMFSVRSQAFHISVRGWGSRPTNESFGLGLPEMARIQLG